MSGSITSWKDLSSTAGESWGEIAEKSGPSFVDEDDFPELGKETITKKNKKALRQKQEPVRQQQEVNLANLPKGTRPVAEDEEDPREQRGRRDYGDRDRDRDRDRGERGERRGRRDEDRPPSKADETRDWRSAGRGNESNSQFSGFARKEERERDFGSFGGGRENRGPRPIRGHIATEKDFPSVPPFRCTLSNIKFEAGEDDVGEFLEEGGCANFNLNPVVVDGKFKGICEVEFEDVDSLKRAAALDEKELLGRSVYVNLPVQESARQERKRLDLKPRTLPVEAPEPAAKPVADQPSPVRQQQPPRVAEERTERTERKKLNLAPRTATSPQRTEEGARPSGIFGDAKPVDNTQVYVRKATPEKPEPAAAPPPSEPKAWGRKEGSAPASQAQAQGQGAQGQGAQGQGAQGGQGGRGASSRADQGRWERGGEAQGRGAGGGRGGRATSQRGGQQQQQQQPQQPQPQQQQQKPKKTKKAADEVPSVKPVQASRNVFDLLDEEE